MVTCRNLHSFIGHRCNVASAIRPLCRRPHSHVCSRASVSTHYTTHRQLCFGPKPSCCCCYSTTIKATTTAAATPTTTTKVTKSKSKQQSYAHTLPMVDPSRSISQELPSHSAWWRHILHTHTHTCFTHSTQLLCRHFVNESAQGMWEWEEEEGLKGNCTVNRGQVVLELA